MPFKDFERRRKWQREYSKKRNKTEKAIEYRRKYEQRLREIWHNGVALKWGMGNSNKDLVEESEIYARNVCLPQLGFLNITKTFKMFPFDFICDFHGQVCLVDHVPYPIILKLAEQKETSQKLQA